MKHYVYWVHNRKETDILTEGYVGVTCDLRDREYRHRPKNRSFEILFEGTRHQCKELEYRLRPEPGIGLNVALGGGGGNFAGRKHTKEWKKENAERCRKNKWWNIGAAARRGSSNSKEHNQKLREANLGENNPMYGKINHGRRGKKNTSEHNRKNSEACKATFAAGRVPWNKKRARIE